MGIIISSISSFLLFSLSTADENQDGSLTRIEMLKFSRALISCIFAVSEATCVRLDDVGQVIPVDIGTTPSPHQKKIASNFGAVRTVAKIFSQIQPADASVSFSQWSNWLEHAAEGSSGHWLSTVLEFAPR